MGGVIAIVYGAFLLRYDVLLTVVTLTLTVASIITVRWSSKRLRPLEPRDGRSPGRDVRHRGVGHRARSSRSKANGAENDLFRRFIARYESVLTIDQRRTRKGMIASALPDLFNALIVAAVISLGAVQVLAGRLTLGSLVAFQALLFGFLSSVLRLVRTAGAFQSLVGRCHQLDQLLARTDRIRRRRPGRGTRRPRDGQAAVGAARGPQPTLRLRRRRPADRRPLVHRRTRPPGRARGRQRQRQVDRGPPRDRPARPVGRAGPARRRPSAPRAGQRPRPLGRVRAAGDPAVRGHGERQRHHVGPHRPGCGDRASRTRTRRSWPT